MKYRIIAAAVIVSLACGVGLLFYLLETSVQEPNVHVAAALEYEKTGDFPKALESIDTALEGDPENPELLWRKGYYLAETGDIENGAAFYAQSLKKQFNAAVAFSAAELLTELGRFDDASIYVTDAAVENPNYIPGMKLAVEIKLARWKINSGEELILFCESNGLEFPLLKAELERRKPVYKQNALENAGSFRHFAYFKNGTVLTGLKDKGHERVFTSLEDDQLAEIIAEMKLVLEHFSLLPSFVIPVSEAPEDILAAELMGIACGVPLLKNEDDISGKRVLVCMSTWLPGEQHENMITGLEKRGASLYFSSIGVTRAGLRKSIRSLDIAGISGAVMLSPVSVDSQKLSELITLKMKNDISSILSFYKTPFENLRLKEKR